MNDRKAATRTEYSRRILAVLVHIQHNLDAALALDELAGIACFSPFHFHRIFRGQTGESVRQHIRRLRLERAAQRLKHGEQPITAIAFEAGYEAHESFTRAFGRAFGCSPSEFRQASALSTRVKGPNDIHLAAADERLGFTPRSEETTNMKVEIRHIERLRVAFLRHVGPYSEVGRSWERVADFAARHALFGSEARMLGACWDDPDVTPEGLLRYDACVAVPDGFVPDAGFAIQDLGGSRYASVLHEGPYEKLGETYAALMGGWFPGSDVLPGEAPSLEFYLNDPESTDAEDLLTEVCMPISREG